MKKERVELLIIDPQNDFCDPHGALFVAGADKDSERLAKMIGRLRDRIDDIHVTLDSHHLVDVAHPIFLVDQNGNHPAPFTMILESDVSSGKWRTTNPGFMKRFIAYLNQLTKNGRYPLCVWPPHCLIGSWGHNVVPVVFEQLLSWEANFAMVDYVIKGSNIWTEHYSAVQAEVPDASDPGTMLNTGLIQTLRNADIIGITGQALSHSVANTVRDIANNFGEDNIKKMVLLIDTTSPVGDLPGSSIFKNMAEDFVSEMTKRGMKVQKSTDFLN